MIATVWPRGLSRSVVTGPSGITWNAIPNPGVVPVPSNKVGDLVAVKYSTRYEEGFGGHDQAEWTIKPFGRNNLQGLFRPGDPVEIKLYGTGVGFAGEYDASRPQPDGSLVCKAKGNAYNLYDYDCIFLNTTPSPDVSYPTNQLVGGNLVSTFYGYEWATQVAGMPISQLVGTIPTGPLGGVTAAAEGVKVGTVLTAHCTEDLVRWAVWDRTLVIGADSTTPKWAYAAAKAGLVGTSRSEFYSHVGVLYSHTAPGTTQADWGIAWYPSAPPAGDQTNKYDVKTIVVERRGLGVISTGRATGIAQGIYELVKGRMVLEGGFTITPGSGFRSAGGGQVDIPFVRAGDAVRLDGLLDEQANQMMDNVQVISKTEYSWTAPQTPGAPAEESMAITLLGSSPSTFGEVIKGIPQDAGSVVAGGV